jgi:hypothetical protein
MSKDILTNVTVLSRNSVGEDEIEALMEENGHDSFEEYADRLEESVELIVSERLFVDADEIPVLDVNVEVEE